MKKRALGILTCAALLVVVLCACGDKAETAPEASDPTALIVGLWNNAENKVITEFNADGTCSTIQFGETVYSDTYTVEKVDDSSIIVTTGDGQTMEITFVDDNTFIYEGTTITRITEENQDVESEDDQENEYTEEAAISPETLILGTWTAGGSNIDFYNDGTAFTVDESGETGDFTYAIAISGDGTFTSTLIDVDGTSSSENAYFIDENTLMIGDTAFSRIN